MQKVNSKTYHFLLFAAFIYMILSSCPALAQNCDQVNAGMMKILNYTVDFTLKAQNEKYDAAKQTALTAIQVAEEIGNWDAVMTFNSRIATNHLILLELDSAWRYASRGMEILENQKDSVGAFSRAIGHFVYGTALSELGQYRKGVDILSKIPLLLEDTLLVNTAYNGTCDDVRFINTAIRKGMESQIPQILGLGYNQTGMGYYRLQEIDRAISYLNLAVGQLTKAGMTHDLAKAYFNLGGAHQAILLSYLNQANAHHSLDTARQDIMAFNKVLELLAGQEQGNYITLSLTYHSMSLSYALRYKEYENGLTYINKALETIGKVDTLESLKAASAMPYQFETLFNAEKAFMLSKLGKTKESSALLAQTNALIKNDLYNKTKARETLTLGSFLMLLATCEALKDWEQLELLLTESLRYLFPNKDIKTLNKADIEALSPVHFSIASQLMWHSGKLFEHKAAQQPQDHLKHLEKALHYYNLAITAHINKLNDFTPPGVRTLSKQAELLIINESVRQYFLDGIKVAHQLYEDTKAEKYTEEAYHIAEKLKGYISRQNVKEIQRFKEVPLNVQEKEFELYENIEYLKNQLKNTKEPDKKRTTEEKLTKAYVALTQFIESLKTSYAQYYNVKYSAETAPVAKVKEKLLDDKTAMIQYVYLSEASVYAFIIQGGKAVHAVQITSSRSLGKMIQELNKAAQNPLFAQLSSKDSIANIFIKNASELYDVLISPFAEKIKNYNKLIIIPDGALHRLDFSLLLSEKVHELPIENGLIDSYHLPYLLKNFAISYAPSATNLLETQNLKKPHLHKTPINYGGFEPDYSNCKEAIALIFDDIKKIQQNHFPSKSKIWFKKDAIKINFKKAMEEYEFKILHFSGHSSLDTVQQNYAYLNFGCGNNAEIQEKLSNRELYDMSIHADLIILASCESGAGHVVQPGEGLPSIAQAFAFAGCPSVIMSQWKMDSAAAKEVVGALFHYLIKEDKPFDVALQLAKLDYLKSTDKNIAELAPKYWASIIAWGNMQSLSLD